MEYRSKYKAEEIEAILDAKNNTGEGVDSNLDELFTGQLQTKEVEVSEDTTITADEGFLGLKEVSVKVSGGGSGGSNIEYLDVSGVDTYLLVNILAIGIPYAKGEIDGLVIAAPISAFGNKLVAENINAIGIDGNATIAMAVPGQTLVMSFYDALAQRGVTKEQVDAIPRITEEEFYTL